MRIIFASRDPEIDGDEFSASSGLFSGPALMVCRFVTRKNQWSLMKLTPLNTLTYTNLRFTSILSRKTRQKLHLQNQQFTILRVLPPSLSKESLIADHYHRASTARGNRS